MTFVQRSIVLILIFPALAAMADSEKPQFTDDQARLIIASCFRFSLQEIKTRNGLNCPENLSKVGEWTANRYSTPQAAFDAAHEAKSINELYVPLFAIAFNAGSLNGDQKLLAVEQLRHVLDRLMGFRGSVEKRDSGVPESEEENYFRRFAVDAIVASAISGIEPKTLISYLNEAAQFNETILSAYDLSMSRRVRFFIDFASHPDLKRIPVEQKSHYLSTFIFREHSKSILSLKTPIYASFQPLRWVQRFNWRSEAEQMVVDKPMLAVLDGLLPMIIEEKLAPQDEFGFPKETKLRTLGLWSRTVLQQLGYSVDEDMGGGSPRRKDRVESEVDCDLELIPVTAGDGKGRR